MNNNIEARFIIHQTILDSIVEGGWLQTNEMIRQIVAQTAIKAANKLAHAGLLENANTEQTRIERDNYHDALAEIVYSNTTDAALIRNIAQNAIDGKYAC